jgi:hypothetical protein
MSEPGYIDKRPVNKPPIENQPARGGEFNEGGHTGAGAIKSREIFRKRRYASPGKACTDSRRLRWLRAQVLSSTHKEVKPNDYRYRIASDDYLAAAASVVEELRDFLSAHYADLINPHMTMRVRGQGGEMPAVANDPQYAARIHSLKMACDAFINAMRGNFDYAKRCRAALSLALPGARLSR